MNSLPPTKFNQFRSVFRPSTTIINLPSPPNAQIMDSPLNLAHFHERRAEKLMKRHRYDEAYKAIETSLLYVQDAHKNVRIPKSSDVLNTQKWDYERKLQQIQMRKQQYERNKLKDIVPPTSQNEVNSANSKAETVNAQSIARSIDKTIKEFNDKYGSTSLTVNMQNLQLEPKKENQDPNKDLEKTMNQDCEPKESTLEDAAKMRLRIFDEHLQSDEELPSLVPLELPHFDYSLYVAGVSGLAENFQK